MMYKNGKLIELPEKTEALNGVRVKINKTGETGTIYFVYLNRQESASLVGVNLDSGGAKVMPHWHLSAINPTIEERKLLNAAAVK